MSGDTRALKDFIRATRADGKTVYVSAGAILAIMENDGSMTERVRTIVNYGSSVGVIEAIDAVMTKIEAAKATR